MINTTKSKIANLLLKNKLAKLKRRVGLFNLQKAKTIGIIYHYDSENTDKEVHDFARFLKEERLKVETLAFVSNKNFFPRVMAQLDYDYFNKKDLSWLRLPKKREALRFVGREFDILIDLTTKTYFPIRYITSLSKAHFKVGESSSYRLQACDLTIDISRHKNMTYLIEQIKHYLSVIN